MPKSSNENWTPSSFQCVHGCNGVFDVLQQQAFGQFQLEQCRIDGMALHGRSALESTKSAWRNCLALTFTARDKVAGECILLPCLELGTSRFQHPLPDGQDQPGFFRQRNELSRRHQTTFRVYPADQCLCSKWMQ